jgi:ABC-type lipoprotein export system ATPase subunit
MTMIGLDLRRDLVLPSRLILADEPTGNLDSQSGEELLQLLCRLNQQENLTVMLVTHDANIASRADRVIHLKDGKILE